MHWLPLALTSATLLGLYNYFIKLASNYMHPVWGVVIMAVGTTTVNLIIFFTFRLNNTPMSFTAKGFWLALLAGACVASAEITAFFMFTKNVSASVGIPVLVAGSVIAGVLFGILFSKEYLNIIQVVGIAFVILGIYLVSSYAQH